MTTVERSWSSRTRLLLAIGAVALVLGSAALIKLMTPGPKNEAPVPEQPPPGAIQATPALASGEAVTTVGGKTAKVRLEVRPGRVREGEHPSMTLINAGATQLSYGLDFRLELRTPRGWHWVNENQAFNLPLLHLDQGDEADPEEIAMYVDTPEPLPLAPGIYRVSRTLDTDVFDEAAPRLRVAARFEVVRADGRADPRTSVDEPFAPYPGSQWYGPDGRPVPMEDETINVITGPDHCEWQSAAMLHTTWPPGTPPKVGTSSLQYIRDPEDAMEQDMDESFEGDTLLPAGARYTGYRTDFMELWVRTYHRGMPVAANSRPPDRIYLVFADHIESWPRAKDPIACG